MQSSNCFFLSIRSTVCIRSELFFVCVRTRVLSKHHDVATVRHPDDCHQQLSQLARLVAKKTTARTTLICTEYLALGSQILITRPIDSMGTAAGHFPLGSRHYVYFFRFLCRLFFFPPPFLPPSALLVALPEIGEDDGSAMPVSSKNSAS
mmetsp:Transcript_12271/g.35044  ORF Transcript_12271/g.35044 Transcript_12271/m.35044 type:complete len:150 (+) Transcript_12271:553-1002(+)